jgi:hypothetical protein
MNKKSWRLIPPTVMLGLAVLSCNLPSGTGTPDTSGTIVASTLSALETGVALTQTVLSVVQTSTPIAGPTLPAGPTATPSGPVVTKDTLCWVGPGKQFEVVSAIRTGARVELLGRGTIPGWLIVRNPIYHDPCWIQARDLQIDPGLDLSGLPYFSPPPTPTPTPTKTPTKTPAPTVTPTNTP